MRILLANKYNFLNGGNDRYFLELAARLKEEGHAVAKFCMAHPRNLPDEFSSYFASHVEYNGRQSLVSAWRAGWKLIYNLEAKRQMLRLLDEFRPDIIHCHNIYHQLSPSILDAAKQRGIPVILHLHDYKLISPNYSLFCQGRINESFAAPHYFRCVGARCVKDSYAKSLLAAGEMFIHHRLLRIYEKNIAAYIAPSRFMKEICVRHGVPADKIETLCYFVDSLPQPALSAGAEPYVLYAGRLSAEKGIETLVQAIALAPAASRLKIAGSGPAETGLRRLCSELKLDDRVEFLGHLATPELRRRIDGAAAVVVPSLWYENMPFSMLEALARGKAVIAARIGGLPEMIKDGENGFLFEAGNAADLANCLGRFQTSNHDHLARQALRSVQEIGWPEHWRLLEKIYHRYVPQP